MNPERGSISKQALFHKIILEKSGISVVEISTKTRTPFKFTSLFKMIRCLKRADAIHVHGCSWWGFLPIIYGVIAAKVSGKKVVVTYHGGALNPFIKRFRLFVFLFLKAIDIITVPSDFLKEILEKIRIHRCAVVYNIIDDQFIKEGEKSNKTVIKPRFIVTRSLSTTYNVKNAILAFEILKKKYTDAKLVIAGDGPLRGELENLVKTRAIKDVIFYGHIPHSRMSKYYSKADIAINPTNIDNMPLSVIEAQASGLCVISTDVGGIPYIIEDMKNGVLVPPNDYKAIARKAEFLLKNQEIALNIIRKAKEDVRCKYSFKRVSQQLLTVYKEIL